jgi:hypothetical protein
MSRSSTSVHTCTFVLTAEMAGSIPGDMMAKELAVTISRQGTLFLWQLGLPAEAARPSEHGIGRIRSVRSGRAIPDPEWPELTMDEIVRIAVRGRVIDTLDHPVLKKLRGEN